MKNSPAANAWAALLTLVFALCALAMLEQGFPGTALLLASAAVMCGLCTEWSEFLPEGERFETAAQPALGEPWTGLSSTVGDEQVAYDLDHSPVEVYGCFGTPDFYSGIDCFGNLITVRDGVIVEFQARTVEGFAPRNEAGELLVPPCMPWLNQA